MSKLSRDLAGALQGQPLHPREALFVVGNFGAANAEVIIPSDGCRTVSLDMRGTFSLTNEVAGTVDGTNWIPIPMRPVNQAAKKYVAAITGTVAGLWVGDCSMYKSVRVRATAWTSGLCVTTLMVDNAPLDQVLEGQITTDIVTAVGAAAAAVTLTLAAPGAGLRHYLTYLSINRFAAAVLTAAATPVTVTTTNLPGSLAFSFAADAAALGSIDRWREDFAFPIAAVAQNTATTFVCPATTGVIWRVSAGFYVAP